MPKSVASKRVKPKPAKAKQKQKQKQKPAKQTRKPAKAKAKLKPTKAKPKARAASKRLKTKPAKSSSAGLAFRLPSTITPSAYHLHVDVDPSRSQSYAGELSIDVAVTRATTQIELHAADINVTWAAIETARGTLQTRIEAHPERETVLLIATGNVPKGAVRVHIAFDGKLRSDLRGFYAASAGDRKYAFTQLEAADARRFFPCFDEPSFKARFTLSVTTDARNAVFSNNPQTQVEHNQDGSRTVHFSETPKLSTYLVALAVGELVASEPVLANGVPIRIVHVPGNEHLTGFALDAARECLLRLADYFDVAYPYEKLDLVAVPDFEIGAMENAGAVFFRETLLLVDERSVSLAETKRAAEVICHELAHMWYGNLVTMRWWDDLWLNEAFATWMAFDIVAKWRPEWKMWNDFGHSKNSALHLDALDNTHAIYTQVATPADATENFDLITYEKGAAVVRMIERYLGPDVFQAGVRKYIKRHRESNAVAADLWRALEEAAGQNVRGVVRKWVEAPGFPLLRVSSSGRAGKSELVVEQERYHAQGRPPAARKGSGAAAKAALWAVPWVARVGHGAQSTLLKHVVTKARTRIALAPGATPSFVYANADEGGFFRPLHAAHDHQALVRALPQLNTSERLGLVQHSWASVRSGYAPLDSFLALFCALASEPDADVLRALVGPAAQLVDDVADSAGPAARQAMAALVVRTFGPALRALGWQAAADEGNGKRLLRAELATLVAVIAEDASAASDAEHACNAYLHDRSALDANLSAAVLTLGARSADAARLATYVAASTHDATPQERRRFRMALGDVRDPLLVEQVLELALTDTIPTQDVALVLARLVSNRHAQQRAWRFVQTRWPEVRARMPAMLVSRLIEATPKLRHDGAQKEVSTFFKSHPVPTAARALRQVNERFKLDAAFRTKAAPALVRFLSDRS